MEFTEVIGITAGICTTSGALPQIVKAVRTKKAQDVSPLMFWVLLLGVTLWTFYGIIKRDWPIIITNGISMLLNGIMLVIIYRHCKK